MKKILASILLTAFLLTACSGLGPGTRNTTTGGNSSNTSSQETSWSTTESKPDTISDYFPMTADTYMKYKGEGNEYASYESYVDYLKDNTIQIRENNGGTEVVLVYMIRDGALVNTFSRGETYYRYDYTASSNKDEILLKEPLEVGTSWTLKDGSARSITAVGKELETPAGKYSTIEVTTKTKDSEIKDYYAKGTGLVKTVFKTNDSATTVTSELEQILKDAPFKHIVRFYFPQFNENRIVYVEREVAVKTNQEMKWQFQKELKTIPETGGLSKTMTKNTQVLGITLDEEKETVTVNLSGDFIKDMNAGTTLEGMLVNSITNTFGSYYMVKKVIILIDGKPYESGHILMKPGEGFEVKTEGVVQFK